jgi:hypothetical protein
MVRKRFVTTVLASAGLLLGLAVGFVTGRAFAPPRGASIRVSFRMYAEREAVGQYLGDSLERARSATGLLTALSDSLAAEAQCIEQPAYQEPGLSEAWKDGSEAHVIQMLDLLTQHARDLLLEERTAECPPPARQLQRASIAVLGALVDDLVTTRGKIARHALRAADGDSLKWEHVTGVRQAELVKVCRRYYLSADGWPAHDALGSGRLPAEEN